MFFIKLQPSITMADVFRNVDYRHTKKNDILEGCISNCRFYFLPQSIRKGCKVRSVLCAFIFAPFAVNFLLCDNLKCTRLECTLTSRLIPSNSKIL
jgi:hypothetical protein